MESKRKIRENNLVDLNGIGISVADSLTLQRISHRLHKLDEAACNYGLTERQEKRVDTLEEQAGNIAETYDMVAYHQSDPRGWSLRVGTKAMLLGGNIDEAYPYLMAVCPW